MLMIVNGKKIISASQQVVVPAWSDHIASLTG